MENNLSIEMIDSNEETEKTYKPKEVAEILNIDSQIIRNYCQTYKKLLDKNHQAGKHRTFSENDVKILKIILYLTREKRWKPQEIINYLNKTTQTKNLDLIVSLEFIFDDVKKEITKNVKQSVHEEIQNQFSELKSSINSISESSNTIQTQQTELLSRTERNKQRKKNGFWASIFNMSKKNKNGRIE